MSGGGCLIHAAVSDTHTPPHTVSYDILFGFHYLIPCAVKEEWVGVCSLLIWYWDRNKGFLLLDGGGGDGVGNDGYRCRRHPLRSYAG